MLNWFLQRIVLSWFFLQISFLSSASSAAEAIQDVKRAESKVISEQVQAAGINTVENQVVDTQVADIQPLRSHRKTSRQIVEQLRLKHYSRIPFNDALSSRVYDEYLNSLDPGRQYFTQQDINKFEEYRHVLDDALTRGDLQIAFEVFNLYQQRVADRLDWLLVSLKTNAAELKKPRHELLELERKNAPWPNSSVELDQLWLDRLRHNLITLKLSGESDEKAFEMLRKRYDNQAKRLGQTTPEDVFSHYMNAVARVFDPHTQYLSPQTSENFRINMSLELEGIGAVLQTEDDYTKVVRLVHGGPAEKSSQLGPADRIIGVGQGTEGEIQDVIGWRLEDVVELIRGPKDSTVRLRVIPSNAENESTTRTFNIVRDKVKLEDRAAKKKLLTLNRDEKEFRIGIIEIPAFYADMQGLARGTEGARSTSKDVETLLRQLENENIDGLVIDLRDNGGGALSEANSVVSLFINQGPTVQIRHVTGSVDRLEDDIPGTMYNGPLAVLVNRLSASASEIFAGAIQDYGRGVVIGERTFGKGTVQSLQQLNRGELKITLAKFYRVSGQSNQNIGIVPDIAFPSLFDPDEIGESALDNALPFDSIEPAAFVPLKRMTSAIDFALAQHDQRTITDADFKYLRSKQALLAKYRQETEVSLDEHVRRKDKAQRENERLEIENALRRSKGEPVFKNYDELQDWEEQELAQLEERNTNPQQDYALRESGHILVDMLLSPNTQVAENVTSRP